MYLKQEKNSMFKELRNKFLILNISIITVIMVSAFVVIYLVTYNNIQSANKAKVNPKAPVSNQVSVNVDENPDLSLGEEPELSLNERSFNEGILNEGSFNEDGQMVVHSYSPEESGSFRIEVDESGNIITILSSLGMSDEVYKDAAWQAWDEHKNYSILRIADKEWMYGIQPIEKNNIITDEYGNQSVVNSVSENYQITFLDVTDDNKTLFTLLLTFLSVGFIMLFVISYISLYFANRAISPIRETFEKQKQFIADASHELKTPLAIINANTEVLLGNEGETIQSQKKWLHHIKSETGRMSILVGDLLYLAKTENSNQTMLEEYFDFSHAIAEVILSMEAIIYEKDLTLTQNIESGLCVTGDKEKINRVVMILLDNAIKYTDKRGLIDIILKRNRHQIEFRIRNSGASIAKEELARVFDRFYRADKSRNSQNGGYGLGLPIAKAILKKAGGELYATSDKKEGTTFIFTLKDR